MDLPVLRAAALVMTLLSPCVARADTVTITVAVADGTASQTATATATNDAQSAGPAVLPAKGRFDAGHPNAILSAP